MTGRAALAILALGVAAGVPSPARALHATAPGRLVSAGAGGAGASFSLQPSIGTAAGTGIERVFSYPLGSKYKLSELTWDFDEVVMGGLEGSADFGRRVRLAAGFWSALSAGDGMMVDRDWAYAEIMTQVIEPGGENWTDESRHPDTTLDEGTVVDVNLSVRALESGAFSISGIVGLTWQRWAWSSRGGTFVYSYDGFRDTSGDFGELYGEDARIIEYEQQYTIPYVGVGLAWQGPALRFDGHLLLSGLVMATDTDEHLLRGVLFEGEFSRGFYVGAGVNGTWLFTPRWYATLGLDYQSIPEITGDVTMSGAEGYAEFGSGGGVALETVMASLGVGLRF